MASKWDCNNIIAVCGIPSFRWEKEERRGREQKVEENHIPHEGGCKNKSQLLKIFRNKTILLHLACFLGNFHWGLSNPYVLPSSWIVDEWRFRLGEKIYSFLLSLSFFPFQWCTSCRKEVKRSIVESSKYFLNSASAFSEEIFPAEYICNTLTAATKWSCAIRFLATSKSEM